MWMLFSVLVNYFFFILLKISSEWERSGTQEKQSPQNGAPYTPTGGYSNGSLVADEELQEFDDLIFVLKAGKLKACSNLVILPRRAIHSQYF